MRDVRVHHNHIIHLYWYGSSQYGKFCLYSAAAEPQGALSNFKFQAAYYFCERDIFLDDHVTRMC